jgi:hypothetical protein
MALETVGKTAGGTQKRQASRKIVKTNGLICNNVKTKEIGLERG